MRAQKGWPGKGQDFLIFVTTSDSRFRALSICLKSIGNGQELVLQSSVYRPFEIPGAYWKVSVFAG
jgi:hypothetical protein